MKAKVDPFAFPTRCAVCKGCFLKVDAHGRPLNGCQFGGPFRGYANV